MCMTLSKRTAGFCPGAAYLGRGQRRSRLYGFIIAQGSGRSMRQMNEKTGRVSYKV